MPEHSAYRIAGHPLVETPPSRNLLSESFVLVPATQAIAIPQHCQPRSASIAEHGFGIVGDAHPPTCPTPNPDRLNRGDIRG